MAQAKPFRRDVDRGWIGFNNLAENARQRNGKSFSDLSVELRPFSGV